MAKTGMKMAGEKIRIVGGIEGNLVFEAVLGKGKLRK